MLNACMLGVDFPPDSQKLELESVKRERRALMDSLAALKADQGSAGSERQIADMARLRQERRSKQEKVNELRQARAASLPALKLADACARPTLRPHCLVGALPPAYQNRAGM